MCAFHLKNEDDDFKSRSDSIFSSVDSIKCKIDTGTLADTDIDVLLKRKLPNDIITVAEPGYKVEPNKWKQYNLETTSTTDDRQNTQTALNFLHQLSKQRKTNKQTCCVEKTSNTENSSTNLNDVVDNISGDENVVCFKKPSAIVMQEHCVNAASSKTSKMNFIPREKKHSPLPSFNKVELDHLEDNTTALEYQVTIEAKLEESITFLKPNTLPFGNNNDEIFKSPKVHKSNRVIRKRNLDEDG